MKGNPQKNAVPLLIGLIRIIRDFCQRQERETCHKLALTSSQLAFLLAMPEQAEFNVHQVAEVMGLSPSRASRVADSLVRHGLLSRRTVDSDRRIQLLALTAAGRTKWQAARSLLAECEQKLLSKLTAKGSRELEAILKTLVDAW
ncbi:MAG: MarR family transcriptional regulator [Syntrophobacteraceae bacterium]